MRVTACEIAGYRSLLSVRLPLGPVSVLVGENGAGKTNLLRALELVQAAATGAICRMLADDGELASVLWTGRAGNGRPAPKSIRLTVHFDAMRYTIEIAGAAPGDAALSDEATVREEILAHTGLEDDGAGERVVMHRQGASVRLRDAKGQRQHFKQHLQPTETALNAFRDAASYPELAYIRELLDGWRIYHRFNLAADASSRAPARAVMIPALARDAGDLAAALATIFNVKGGGEALLKPLRDPFPGATIEPSIADGQARFRLRLPDFQRPLQAREISDGTLQYICLLAAFMAYRKPALIAINEPETSLHESLLAPLARLIAGASARSETGSQVCIVTQSNVLAREIAKAADTKPLTIRRQDGQTMIDGVSAEPAPTRTAETVTRTPNSQPAKPLAATAAPVPSPAAKTENVPPPPTIDAEATVVIVKPMSQPTISSTASATSGEPELDAQIEEVRSLTAARAVLAEIRKLIARLREHPEELSEIHPKIEARLAKLRSTAVTLPPEFSALTSRLHEELRSIVGTDSKSAPEKNGVA